MRKSIESNTEVESHKGHDDSFEEYDEIEDDP